MGISTSTPVSGGRLLPHRHESVDIDRELRDATMRFRTGLFLVPLLLVQLTLPGFAADRFQLFVNFIDATSCPRANKASATCLRAQASLIDFQEKKHFHCQVSFWNAGEVKDPATCVVTTDCRDCGLLFNNDQRVSVASLPPFGVNVAVNGNIIWNLDPQSRRLVVCLTDSSKASCSEAKF